MRLAAWRRDPSGKPKGVVIVAFILSTLFFATGQNLLC